MTVTLTTEKYRAHPGDFVLADTTSIAAFDVVLPPVSEGGPVQVHNITGTNAVTVKTEDGATIDGGSGSTGIAYTDAQTGATFISDFFKWYSIPTASGGGSPTRFAAADVTVNTAGQVPVISFPLVTPLEGNLTFGTSVPGVVAAGDYVVQSVDFNLPNDGGAPMVVVFVELVVSNADGSEVRGLIPADNWGPLSVPADGNSHKMVVGTDLTVTEFQTGTDLTVSGGAIKSTAGGAFFVQVAFNFTV